MAPERYLCSHLVRIFRNGTTVPPETVVLEEIDPWGAVIRAGRAYEVGLAILIEAEGFLAPATIVACSPDDDDYEIEALFSDNYQWSRYAWEPDHLHPARSRARSRGVGGAG